MIEIRITEEIRDCWFTNSHLGENMTVWLERYGGEIVYKIVGIEDASREVLDYIRFENDVDATVFVLKLSHSK